MDLQEHLSDRQNHINTCKGWVKQITGTYHNWVRTAAVSQPLWQSMLTTLQRREIHSDFVKATEFLGTIYRAYEDLINVDPTNRVEHIETCNDILGNVRKCFKWIKTHAIPDNYFRTISDKKPALYPEHQPKSALEQNSLEYLMSLAQLEMKSI